MNLDQAIKQLTGLRERLGDDAPLVLSDGTLATFGEDERTGVFVTSLELDGVEMPADTASERWRLRRKGLDPATMTEADIAEAGAREAIPDRLAELRHFRVRIPGPGLDVIRFLGSGTEEGGPRHEIVGYAVPDTDDLFAANKASDGWRLSHVPTGYMACKLRRFHEVILAGRQVYRACPEAWRFTDPKESGKVPKAVQVWCSEVMKAAESDVPLRLLKHASPAS
jgi:hypothetical protein